MTGWPKKPIIYQINTWVWLNALTNTYGKRIHLGNIPDSVIDSLAEYHFDAVWPMGVWHRSTAVRASALNYVHEYRGALPDIKGHDVVGSAYAIGDYTVDSRIGGPEGLAIFREQLRARGMKMILDFVPNHVAVDHPWVSQHPEYFITGNVEDVARDPVTFYMTTDDNGEDLVVAHGRDPYFPAWIDTAQLNAFNPELRRALLKTLEQIAGQCDGVRCDMAMLVTNNIFGNTWKQYAGTGPHQEFWHDIIPQTKSRFPDFIFIAEVYWGMEWSLQQQGFDLTYDKTLYDRIQSGEVDKIHQHLWAELPYQEKSLRFIENHDEPRAAAAFGVEKSRAAAVLINTLPGAVLLHDGQFIGRTIKLPVQISRQPNEVANEALHTFYRRLLTETRDTIYREGRWQLIDIRSAGHQNHTHINLLAYSWTYHDDYRLVVINLTPKWSQGVIPLRDWGHLAEYDWQIYDTLHSTYRYEDGGHAVANGLYVELEPFSSHIFHLDMIRKADPVGMDHRHHR